MWQDVVVYAILALAGGLTLWRSYRKFTGKASCCDGGCSCGGSCPSGVVPPAGEKPVGGKPCGPGLPMSGGSCNCR